ncbi:LysR family transcriptional regulator [Bosea sp. CS1GBMeth4]|uniref:LysR family transcriptional regulator n=1 Tax=Bosea sp. CS1GBMeth4 TaxID=1892849 RepID=UPI0016451940|nr:LysR family transcriptional regulator [Bosea sp. CS1GBMeth4]
MLDALTLDQMRVFLAVAEAGSFRAAAVRLSRVQSAVSHAIANLEAELGIALFDRSGHRPALTPEGQAVLANMREILLRVGALRARARGLGEGVEIELALTIDVLFPLPLIGAALAEVRARYPSVSIRVAVEPLGGPIAALLARRSALAITVGEDFRDPRIAVEALMGVEMIAVVAPAHPLARAGDGGTLTRSELAEHLQIVQIDPTPLSGQRDFGVLSPQTCRVTGQDSKHAMILAGLGWGRLPRWLIERDLAEGRLVRLATRALGRRAQLPAETYLAHRLDEAMGPAARAFAEALRRLCAED